MQPRTRSATPSKTALLCTLILTLAAAATSPAWASSQHDGVRLHAHHQRMEIRSLRARQETSVAVSGITPAETGASTGGGGGNNVAASTANGGAAVAASPASSSQGNAQTSPANNNGNAQPSGAGGGANPSSAVQSASSGAASTAGNGLGGLLSNALGGSTALSADTSSSVALSSAASSAASSSSAAPTTVLSSTTSSAPSSAPSSSSQSSEGSETTDNLENITLTSTVSAPTASETVDQASADAAAAAASASASASAEAAAEQNKKSSGGIGKSTLIIIIVVASVVALVIAIWTIVRKTVFSPSSRFSRRTHSIDFGAGHRGSEVFASSSSEVNFATAGSEHNKNASSEAWPSMHTRSPSQSSSGHGDSVVGYGAGNAGVYEGSRAGSIKRAPSAQSFNNDARSQPAMSEVGYSSFAPSHPAYPALPGPPPPAVPYGGAMQPVAIVPGQPFHYPVQGGQPGLSYAPSMRMPHNNY